MLTSGNEMIKHFEGEIAKLDVEIKPFEAALADLDKANALFNVKTDALNIARALEEEAQKRIAFAQCEFDSADFERKQAIQKINDFGDMTEKIKAKSEYLRFIAQLKDDDQAIVEEVKEEIVEEIKVETEIDKAPEEVVKEEVAEEIEPEQEKVVEEVAQPELKFEKLFDKLIKKPITIK